MCTAPKKTGLKYYAWSILFCTELYVLYLFLFIINNLMFALGVIFGPPCSSKQKRNF